MLDLQDIINQPELNLNDFFAQSIGSENLCRIEMKLTNATLPNFSDSNLTATHINDEKIQNIINSKK